MEQSVNQKLNLIENEIINLKDIIINIIQQKPKKILHLKRLLKGISISDEDIKKAKKSLFKLAS